MYLLDTNMCIDFMRNRRPEVYKQMSLRGPDLVKLPSLVVAELWYGVQHSQNPRENRRVLEQFLKPFDVIPFDEICARHYGMLRQHLASQGMPIGPNDTIIAATALAHGAILVTNNVKEFQRVPGLQVEAWYEIDLLVGSKA